MLAAAVPPAGRGGDGAAEEDKELGVAAQLPFKRSRQEWCGGAGRGSLGWVTHWPGKAAKEALSRLPLRSIRGLGRAELGSLLAKQSLCGVTFLCG